VDAIAEDDATIRERVGKCLSGGCQLVRFAACRVFGNVQGACVEAIEAAYKRGAVVLAEDSGAAVYLARILGRW
jgi:hypothetical protein